MAGRARRPNKAIEDRAAGVVAAGAFGDAGGALQAPQSLTFAVPGHPVPWERSRHVGRRHFTPPRSAAYREAVVLAFLRARPAAWPLGALYALGLEITPSTHGHGDLSNYFKQIEDALQGYAWANDKQIRAYLPSCITEPSRTGAGVVVRVGVLKNKSA